MNQSKGNAVLALCLTVGWTIGGLIGLLLRPSVMLIGQLPLMVVLTRGAFLRGFDQVLVPVAQQSFNILFVCAFLGTMVGGVVGVWLRTQSTATTSPTSDETADS